jgi:hypothetical protein
MESRRARLRMLFGQPCAPWRKKPRWKKRLSESLSDLRMVQRFLEQARDDRNHAEAIRKMLSGRDHDPLKSAA